MDTRIPLPLSLLYPSSLGTAKENHSNTINTPGAISVAAKSTTMKEFIGPGDFAELPVKTALEVLAVTVSVDVDFFADVEVVAWLESVGLVPTGTGFVSCAGVGSVRVAETRLNDEAAAAEFDSYIDMVV